MRERRRILPVLVGCGLGIAGLGLAVPTGVGWTATQATAQSGLPEACLSDNPYFATSNYVRGETFDGEPGIWAFNDTPDDSGHHQLATFGEVGATYGIAYDPAKDVLYAGAFHKRNSRYGPLGPGGVYEVQVNAGGVRPFVTVPNAGINLHDPENNYHPDERSRAYAGKTSLGDLDMNEKGTELFVMNLNDRQIYRYALPDGRRIGTLPTGGKGASWSRDARPFGLKVQDGWVYHAVINSSETRQSVPNLSVHVYASRPDGTGLREVAQAFMGYDRPGNHEDWHPWPEEDDMGWRMADYPHPMPTDIEFTAAGDMILGIRDRYMDTGPTITEVYRRAAGDILLLKKTGALAWTFDPNAPEHFTGDGLAGVWDETAIGGLARLFTRDVVVTTAIDPFRTYSPQGRGSLPISAGAIWLDDATGEDLSALGPGLGREELIYNGRQHEGPQGKALGLGDLELICYVPPTPTPTDTVPPTDTPTATLTASATPTATDTAAPTATPTVTPTPTPHVIYLPMAEKSKPCESDAYRTDVVLVLDRSTSMLRAVEPGGMAKNEAAIAAARSFVDLLDLAPNRLGRHDQVAVVGFNDDAWIEEGLTSDREAALGALERIRGKTQEGTRLDLAFAWGQKPLEGPKRRLENRAVVIVLTDGLPNRVPYGPGTAYPGSQRQEDSVLAAAEAVKAAGTRVYTIGLGSPRDILPWLMIAGASERAMYHYAPRPEELGGIYAQIAQTFDGCNPAPVKPRCVPDELHADVVLVIDMSTSMHRGTRSGRTKHEAALEAARGFAGQLDLALDGWGRQDQLGIVGFNDEAWTAVGLTSDRGAIEGAIDGLLGRVAEGTRLDLALAQGQAVLGQGPRLQPNAPVVVLLTDGLPNRVPVGPGGTQEETVLGVARQVKGAGTVVYTIGLGEADDVLRPLLEGVATRADMYRYAPDGEDLAAIYREIAGRLQACDG